MGRRISLPSFTYTKPSLNASEGFPNAAEDGDKPVNAESGRKEASVNISYSQVEAFVRCPEAHYWAYVRRITPATSIKALTFGSDMHKLLQFRGKKFMLRQAAREISETFNENINALGDDYLYNLKTIWSDYCKQWRNTELPTETEHRFEILLGTYKGEPIYFVGVIDEIYEGELKRLGEHKTFSRDPSMISLHFAIQAALYAKARQLETGELPDIIQWDHIKSAPASYPVWLEKSKRFSVSASKSITEWSYKRACEERSIVPDPVWIDSYRNNNSNFFFRTPIEVNPDHVERVFETFKEKAKHIVSSGMNCHHHHYGRDCSWCKYQPLCYAEYSGADVEDIISRDYKEKETLDTDEKASDD